MSRVVPASTQSDSDLNAPKSEILRSSLIPASTSYLQQLLPSPSSSKDLPADIETIPPPRIDIYLGKGNSARDTIGEVREIERREVEFIPIELAKAFVRRVEEDAKGLDRQYRATLKDMDRTYEQLEAETQAIYKRFIDKLQAESMAQIQYHRETTDKYEQEFRQYKADSERTLRMLQEKIHLERSERKEISQTALADSVRMQEEHMQELAILRETNRQGIETVKRLEEQGKGYRERVEGLEKELGDTQALVNTLRIDAETRLKGVEESKATETADLREELRTLQAKYDFERTQLNQQITVLGSSLSTHQSCESDIAALMLENMGLGLELQYSYTRPEASLGQIVATIVDKRKQCDSLKQTPSAALTIQGLEAEVQDLCSQAASMGYPLAFAESGETQQALSSALSTIKKLQNALIAGSSEQDLKDILAGKEQEIALLQEQVKHLEGLFAPSTSTEDALVSALKAKLSLTASELQDSQSLIEKLTTRIKELEDEITKLAGQKPEDTEKIARLTSKIDKLEELHKREKGKLEGSYRTEMETHKRKSEEAEGRNRDLDQQVRELDRRIREEREQFQRVQEDLTHLGRLKLEHSQLSQEIAQLRQANQLKETELKESVRLRKALHNEVQDMKGKIRVYCRARPMNKDEISRQTNNILSFPDEFTISCETKQGLNKQFAFDSVFGPLSSQDEVFEETKGLVQSAVDGYNVCIFAYGQTGSGKTFTMQGTDEMPGVTPRAFSELFSLLRRLPEHYQWKVSCYMVELYLDTLLDLLKPNARAQAHAEALVIKKDLTGMVEIPGVTIVEVSSPEDLLRRFEQGEAQRHTGATKMNDTSSRSHLVFSVFVDVNNLEIHQRSLGKLSLVDLAGSERVSKAESTADRLREGRAINKSLTALGDVIAALSGGESHIPYRNNKLTMLMSDSLGGTAKTLMFANVSPSSYNREETLMSMYYASRVKLITNDPFKNLETKEQSRLKDAFLRLQVKKAKYKQALYAGVPVQRIQELLALPLQEALPGSLDDSIDDQVQGRID